MIKRWEVLCWNGCRRSLFHVSLPLIFRKTSRSVKLQSNAAVPHRCITYKLWWDEISYCRYSSPEPVWFIFPLSIQLSCDHYLHRFYSQTWIVVYCWHLGTSCPQIWNKTKSVAQFFLVVVTVTPIILYLSASIPTERKINKWLLTKVADDAFRDISIFQPQIWARFIIECEDSVSPLWVFVFPAPRMVLKAVCL